MKLFLEKGTLRTELTDALEHFEKKINTLGLDPDELMAQFHHSNLVTPAEEEQHMMCIFKSRKKYLEKKEYADKNIFLSVIK